MTSSPRHLGLAAVLAATAQVGASAAVIELPQPQLVPRPPTIIRPAPQAPAALAQRIDQLARQFNGRVGIAVKSVDYGWSTGWRETELFPQQSVSKLWVAITALDAADKGRVRMSDPVTLTRSDLTLFHQPIAQRVLGGGHSTTLSALMYEAITKSDNTANDKLMRSVGGPSAVRDMIAAKRLGAIRFYNGERSLQSRIAGLAWTQSYSVGRAFYQARDALPYAVRKAAFERYIEDPYDGAAPGAIVEALARLKRGELLSPASTQRLLSVMGNTKSGPNRLKGGLKPGWTLGHKTGTGQVLGGEQAGYNDIGVLTAPDGRSYAVAVMIKRTSTPLPTRMTLMNNVVRAVIAEHEAGSRGAYTL